MDEFRWIFSGVVCGGSGLAAAGYLFGHYYLRWFRGAGEAAPDEDRRGLRRRLGAGLVVLVSVGFYAGVNHVDPVAEPAAFAGVWLLVLLQLLWLFLLAGADIRQNISEHRLRRERLREQVREQMQSWLDTRDDDR
jgi:uncharacterized BrkB/YihY/UPF0761 family membrane protein